MIEKEKEGGGWKSWEEVRKDAVKREKWKQKQRPYASLGAK